MTKKPQPQAKENQKQKLQIVDQQNEPFLRALQKKVRNINKKLQEIVELQQKKDGLKPEQVEKINRKEALIEERSRLEDTAILFKQTLAENVEHYRNNQLKELDQLARLIAVYNTSPQFNEYARLSELWKTLESTKETINLTAASIAQFLRNVANDKKFQKALNAFVGEHGDQAVQQALEEAVKKGQIQEKEQVNIMVEEILNEKGEEVATVEVIERVHDHIKQTTVIYVTEQPVVEETSPAQLQNQPVSTPSEVKKAESPQENAATKPQEKEVKNEENKRHYEKKERRYQGGDRGERNYQGGERNDYRGGYKRNNDQRERRYKPKEEYEEKKRSSRSSSSDSQERVARGFKQEEIKQLEDDGFIVVGKPKPKAKDQQKVYEHQHGRKFKHPKN